MESRDCAKNGSSDFYRIPEIFAAMKVSKNHLIFDGSWIVSALCVRIHTWTLPRPRDAGASQTVFPRRAWDNKKYPLTMGEVKIF
jgi:hypothetical protein